MMKNGFDVMTSLHHTNPEVLKLAELAKENQVLKEDVKAKRMLLRFGAVLFIVGLIYLVSKSHKPQDD